jgi:hypothetical protein
MFNQLFGSVFKFSSNKKSKKRALPHSKESKRRALTHSDPRYRDWLDANEDRVRKAQEAEPAYPDTSRIAEQLTENGIVVGTTNEFLEEEGRMAFEKAAKLVLNLTRSSEVQSIVNQGSSHDKKDFMIRLIPNHQKHNADSPFLRMALDKKLLEIVARYLGMWPQLHAIGAWINFPTADNAKQSQLWHRDPEDFRLVKVFIYLEDVSADNGPFSYIPETQPFGARAAVNPVHGHSKRITDEEMQAAIPAQDWFACTGPAGTMILADTVGFHRGGKPKVGHRILITFSYTSGTPFSEGVLKVGGSLDWASHDIQRYALFPIVDAKAFPIVEGK